jgi:hypothetical protein
MVQRKTRLTPTLGMAVCETVLLVSDVQGSLGRYWAISLGRYEELGGHPLDRPEHVREISQRADAANRQVREFLQCRMLGCPILNCAVTFPKELCIFQGTTELFHWQPDLGGYTFTDMPSPPDAAPLSIG